MFYPVESLRKGGRFYLCWIADSYPVRFNKLPIQQIWSQDIRDLCNALNEVIVRESGNPSNRFSLRLSSQLIRGLARLYERKVNIFVGNLCMVEAHILRNLNIRDEFSERSTTPRPFPQVVITELSDEEHLEERIQNSGNVVARIQDITLQEKNLPVAQLPSFGFGEEDDDQMTTSTPEVMVAGDEAAGQISVMDITNQQAQDMDKSRDILHVQAAVHMELISYNDMNLFRPSVAVSEIQNEAEVPPIPDIPPELPAPTTNELRVPESEMEKDTDRACNRADRLYMDSEELEPHDFVEIAQRRKQKNLIIDKKTCLDRKYMKRRMEDVKIGLRYNHPSDCVYDIHHIPAETSLREPGRRFPKGLHNRTASYAKRSKLASPKQNSAENQHEMELVLQQEPTRTSRSDGDIQVPEICLNDQTPRTQTRGDINDQTQMLQAADLGSIQVQTRTAEDAQQKLNESLETPLGSLDSTEVSRDSQKTSVSMKFVLEQWNTEGTLTLIAKLYKEGLKEVTLDCLLSNGPSLPNKERTIAARCFASLLKLKQEGLVTLTKNPATLEINTISLTDKCLP